MQANDTLGTIASELSRRFPGHNEIVGSPANTRPAFPKLVKFRDGVALMRVVFIYHGSAVAGDPTAYVYRDGAVVWVKPGESVDFVEAQLTN